MNSYYLLTKIGFDAVENDPSKVWRRILGYCLPAGGYWDTRPPTQTHLNKQHCELLLFEIVQFLGDFLQVCRQGHRLRNESTGYLGCLFEQITTRGEGRVSVFVATLLGSLL